MQRIIYFLYRNKNFILFLLLLIFCLFININYNQYNKSKFLDSSNSFFAVVYNAKSNISKYFNLEYQNKLLLEENRRLQFQLYNLEEKKINEFTKTNFDVISGSVIKNTYSFSKNFITIDLGNKDSIGIDNGVISSSGVVGIIDKSTNNYSRLISILNTNFFLNAKIKNSNFFGVLSWDGKNINRVQLNDISKQAEISIGDTIITGGNSLIFPKGITIGFIESYKLDESQNYLEIEINLSTDMTNLEKIYVIKNNNIEEINSLNE